MLVSLARELCKCGVPVTLILTKTPFLQEIFGFDQGTSSNYMDLAQNFRDLKSTRFCNKPPLDKDMNY